MKKVMFLFIALIFALPLIAQDAVPPDDIVEWVSRFPEMIGSFWGVSVSILLLPAIVIGFLNVTGKWLKYAITGGLAAVLIALATFLEIGYLNEAKVWWVILNWIFLIGANMVGYAALKPFLDAIEDKFNPWKPKPE